MTLNILRLWSPKWRALCLEIPGSTLHVDGCRLHKSAQLLRLMSALKNAFLLKNFVVSADFKDAELGLWCCTITPGEPPLPRGQGKGKNPSVFYSFGPERPERWLWIWSSHNSMQWLRNTTECCVYIQWHFLSPDPTYDTFFQTLLGNMKLVTFKIFPYKTTAMSVLLIYFCTCLYIYLCIPK